MHPLKAIVTISPPPLARCPLQGPARFSYDFGRGSCHSPLSNMESCTLDSRWFSCHFMKSWLLIMSLYFSYHDIIIRPIVLKKNHHHSSRCPLHILLPRAPPHPSKPHFLHVTKTFSLLLFLIFTSSSSSISLYIIIIKTMINFSLQPRHPQTFSYI